MNTPIQRRDAYRAGRIAATSGAARDTNLLEDDDLRKRWFWGWDAQALEDLLAKTPIPDQSLIAECENLIPKGFYWCGHELNRTLSYYREACHTKDVREIKLNERTLRQVLVNARLEAAGLPIKR